MSLENEQENVTATTESIMEEQNNEVGDTKNDPSSESAQQDNQEKKESTFDDTKKNNTTSQKNVNLLQNNEQVGNGSQTNDAKLNFLRNEDPTKTDSFISIIQKVNTQEGRKKSIFNELEKKEYLLSLNAESIDYLEYYTNLHFAKFSSERIILINNLTGQEAKSLAVIDLLLRKSKYENIAKLYSHSHSDLLFKPLQVIYDFNEKIKEEKKRHQNPFFLILKSAYNNSAEPYSQIEAIMLQTADQNSAIRMLKESNSYLIIFTKNTGWMREVFQRECKLPYINMSTLHDYLWGINLGAITCTELLNSIEIAQADYNWLSDKTNDQKLILIKNYVEANSLTDILTDYISKKTNEELTTVNELLKDSIKKIILFNSTFFPKVSIIEYEAIINAIITQSSTGDEKDTHFNTWKDKADIIMQSCGIILTENESKVETCKFAIDSRSDTLSTLMLKEYKFFLQVNCDILIQQYLYNSKYLSAEFLDGLFELVLAVRNDKGLYLRMLCSNIVSIIENEEEKEDIAQIFFARLIFLIEKWQSNIKQNEYLVELYQDFLASKFKRNVLGSILWHLCNSNTLGNISYLKLYLENSKQDQESEKYKIVRKVIYNYKGNLTTLFKTFLAWNNLEIEKNQVSEAFFQVNAAVILDLYENRFGNKLENKLDYHLVHECIKEKTKLLYRYMNLFLFPKNGLTIIAKLIRRNNKGRIINDAIKDKVQLDWLYYVWAFTSIRIVYLYRYISTKNNALNENEIKKTTILLLKKLKRQGYSLKYYENGIRDAMEEFSNKIGEESEKDIPNDYIRLACKNCIQIAKELIEIVRQINYAYIYKKDKPTELKGNRN
jgi:hypothetical protein